jgi:hypothetical protein
MKSWMDGGEGIFPEEPGDISFYAGSSNAVDKRRPFRGDSLVF